MDGHSIQSSGLRWTKEELKSRMDCVDTEVCTRCGTLSVLHSCNFADALVKVSVPQSKMVLDLSNLITNGYITKYKLEFYYAVLLYIYI